jgi:hypothetical protein
LSEGSIDIVVRRLEADEQFEVDTPASAVTLTQAGIYRIDVDPDGNSTKVTVRSGVAEVYSDRADFRVYAGQTGSSTTTRPASRASIAPMRPRRAQPAQLRAGSRLRRDDRLRGSR